MRGTPSGLTPDQEAVWLSTQVSIAASGLDGPSVLGLMKSLSEALAEGRIELRAVPKPALVDGQPFRGKPMSAKFGGTCIVCSKPIRQGESIVYNSELRKAGHLGCAVPDTTRRSRP